MFLDLTFIIFKKISFKIYSVGAPPRYAPLILSHASCLVCLHSL